MTYKKTNRRDDDSRGSDRKFNSDKPKRKTSSSRTPAPKAGPFDKFDIKKMRDAKTESLEKKERKRPSDKKFRSLEDKKFRNLEDKNFRSLEGKKFRSSEGTNREDKKFRNLEDKNFRSSERPNREDKNFRSSERGERSSDRPTRGNRTERNERPLRSSDRGERNTDRGNRNFEDKKFRNLEDKNFRSSERPNREDKNFRSGGRGERSSDRPARSNRTERSDRPLRSSDRGERNTDRGPRNYDRNERNSDRPARGNRTERSDRPLRSSDRGERNTERGNRNLEDKKFRSLEDKNSRSSDRREREPRTDSRSGDSTRENKRVRTSEKSSEKKEVSGYERKKTNPEEEIRLNRYIANSGVCSRRKADELIEKGEVTVNGEVIRELGYKVKYSDKIKFEGKLLKPGKLVYVLLNKPKDYITTMDDPMERRTVVDLTSKVTNERIFPVGRLDRNTTGLLLLTNDGDLADKLSHPRNQVKKVYEVELDKSLIAKDFEKVREGVDLEDGPAKVDQISYLDGKSKKFVGVEIHIGRNRIVRRIFESLGYEVVRLDRVIYAGLSKKDLPRGRSRMLTKEEIIYLKHLNKY